MNYRDSLSSHEHHMNRTQFRTSVYVDHINSVQFWILVHRDHIKSEFIIQQSFVINRTICRSFVSRFILSKNQ